MIWSNATKVVSRMDAQRATRPFGSVGTGKSRAIKEASGTQIFLPDRNRVYSELSETDAAAVSRIVTGEKRRHL